MKETLQLSCMLLNLEINFKKQCQDNYSYHPISIMKMQFRNEL